jgi:hypothetical protein
MLPYILPESILNLVPLPISWVISLLGVTVLYVIVSEITKKFFYSRST